MVLHVHRSNRTERLVDALARSVARAPLSPFQPEWVAVSSPGMERWLSMQLASRLGVWAHPAFPFPRRLIEAIFSAVLPNRDSGERWYDPTCMLFGIARLLRERAGDPAFAAAERYCGAEPDLRRLSLAGRLADMFDQYLTYRPELVLGWQAGSGEADDLQAALFAALSERHGREHMAARARAALARLRESAPVPASSELPQRLHVFGVSTLPPLYVDVLAAYAQQREVNLYLLSPTREYFGDVRSPRERRRSQRQLSFIDDGFRAEGHPLLGSFGRHAREFHELLEERTQYQDTSELYDDPGCDTLLHTLQSDLLQLRVRGSEVPRHRLSADDHSLAIHACHGPMRELEVLHDQLLRLVADRGVAPHEIVVMAPDIAEYAPVIDAVFSHREADQPALPFRIADRGAADTQPLLLALEAVLDVLEGRFGANQVLDLLAIDLVRGRFEIAPDQVETLREWVEESGIRWGVDAAHRVEVGQPAQPENTWRFGLDRLALGFSTAHPPERLFAGSAPALLDSGEAQLLGSFLELCDRLFVLRREVGEPGTPAEWRERFERLLEALFDLEASSAPEQKLLRRALTQLEEHAALAGYEERFVLASMRALLRRMLGLPLPAHGFLSGGVTFCQLMPMRSIPFKVLCLIGLNDGVFPASENAFAFDLMRTQRKAGDRSRRDDDRQLFLEALLCAREFLFISYLGQSHKDGKALPPSVLVSELLDHVAQSCEVEGADPRLSPLAQAEQRLVVRHPLSPASPRYFGADPDPRLFSFSRGACRAALAFQRPRARPEPFAILKRPPPAARREIALAELERCLMRPSREFCQQRLGLYLGDDLARVEEREPFALDALERWLIATELLEREQRGEREAAALPVQRAQGRLPLAAAGAHLHAGLEREVAGLLRRHAEAAGPSRLAPLELELVVDGVRLSGRLDELWPGALVSAQYGRLTSRHELRQFIRHVALCCAAQERPELSLPQRSVLIGRKQAGTAGVVSFGPLSDPHAVLRDLLDVYQSALREPLPLFAGASAKYVEVLASKGPGPAPLLAASESFASGAFARPGADDLDPYVQQLYPDFASILEHWPGAFERAAERVYGPLLRERRQS